MLILSGALDKDYFEAAKARFDMDTKQLAIRVSNYFYTSQLTSYLRQFLMCNIFIFVYKQRFRGYE